MIFIKKFKLFVIFILSLLEYVHARSVSITQIGNVQIQITEDKWICDQIECPLDTDSCYVSESNEKSPSILVRTDICYSKDNQVLKEKVTSTPTDPNSKINMEVIAYADGDITTINDYSGERVDEKKLQERIDHNLGHMESKIKSQMASMNKKLANEMKNIDRNLQTQMKDLEKSLSGL